MEPTQNNTQVNFSAYCRAFGAIKDDSANWGSKICSTLDPSVVQNAFYSVVDLERGGAGDGFVEVKKYAVVAGEVKVLGSRFLFQDGKFWEDYSGRSRREFASVDREVAQYFIAGAFGMGELNGGLPLDPKILEGLQSLYGECVQNQSTCLDTQTAKGTTARWQGMIAERKLAEQKEKERLAEIERQKKAFEDSKAKFGNVSAKYIELAGRVSDTASLSAVAGAVTMYMPPNLITKDDYDKAVTGYEKLIKIAEGLIKKEQQDAEAKAADSEKRRQIAYYGSQMSGMRKYINDKEGWFYRRFTDAYDAAMKCMPMPTTLEDQYCVARNKYEMGTGLARKADAHPEHSICVKSREVSCDECDEDESPATDNCDAICVNSTKTECTEWGTAGYDTSASEAKEFATGYCTTQCK